MWTSIYVANNKLQANKMRSALEAEGILTDIRPLGGAADSSDCIFEIRVLESEVEEAQDIVCGVSPGI